MICINLELFCEPISCYNFMAGCGDDLKHLLWEMGMKKKNINTTKILKRLKYAALGLLVVIFLTIVGMFVYANIGQVAVG